MHIFSLPSPHPVLFRYQHMFKGIKVGSLSCSICRWIWFPRTLERDCTPSTVMLLVVFGILEREMTKGKSKDLFSKIDIVGGMRFLEFISGASLKIVFGSEFVSSAGKCQARTRGLWLNGTVGRKEGP